MDKNSIAKIVTDRVKAIEAEEFQSFCDRLLLKMYPKDYTPVRAGAKYGDMKNDGYCYISRKFFQAHASRGETISKIETKIKDDLEGCVSFMTSESANNMPFQRHGCPGPDFWSEKGKNALFSPNTSPKNGISAHFIDNQRLSCIFINLLLAWLMDSSNL